MTRFALVLQAALLAMLPLAAQTSSLQGIVTDGQAAAIPDAVVTATNTATASVRKTITNETGAYLFAQIAPGNYKLLIEKPGFKTQSAEIVLQTNTPATMNLQLVLGQVNETVSVTAEAALVNTENAAVGNPFTEKQI